MKSFKAFKYLAMSILFLMTNLPWIIGQQAIGQKLKPNIILILLDDQDEIISPYWAALARTKERLKEKGITFPNAFVTTSICCPSRASSLTGKYGRNTGVLTNGGEYGGWQAFRKNESSTVAVYLKNAGYRTVMIGKYMNGYEYDSVRNYVPPIPPGWSEWYVDVDKGTGCYDGYNYHFLESNGIGSTIVHYGNKPTDYVTDVVAKKAVEFIDRNKDVPFFMYVASTAPHLPLPPAPRHEKDAMVWKDSVNKYVKSRPNYNEDSLSDKPLWLRVSGDNRSKRIGVVEDDFPNRMGSLYAIDDMVESIMQALKRNNRLDSTYIIFTSDNGYNLGAHRLLNKMAPYEESIRVPLVIAGPGIRRGVDSAMVLNIDFAPTFLELAGIDTSGKHMDGESLVPLLRRPSPVNWRNDFVIEYIGSFAGNGIGEEIPIALYYFGIDIPTYRGIRTKRHVYLEWYDYEGHGFFSKNADSTGKAKEKFFTKIHEYELYDLQRDTFQLNNLLSTVEGKRVYKGLALQLKNLLELRTKAR